MACQALRCARLKELQVVFGLRSSRRVGGHGLRWWPRFALVATVRVGFSMELQGTTTPCVLCVGGKYKHGVLDTFFPSTGCFALPVLLNFGRVVITKALSPFFFFKKEQQVAERHVEASMWKASPPRATSTLRVMQYNVLADAMSDDGFLVRPVLADWPVPERAVPTAEGGQVDFTALLAEMMEAKGKPSLLEECQRKYTCSASAENTRAVIDWEARKLQMMCLIENFDPDVVVLAELDHYDQFLGLLRSLGYESQLEKCKKDTLRV